MAILQITSSGRSLITSKSIWKLPTGRPNLEIFLSELKKQIFKIVDSKLGYSTFSKVEWQAMRALADNKSIVIKKANKGSTVVVWDRNDYILETEKQLSDANVYKDVSFDVSFSFFKTSNLKEKFVINNLNALHMSIKKFLA